MNAVSFNVKLPDKCYKFSIPKHHRCTITEPVECDEAGITKTISPSLLVYAVKEFNLLNRFHRRIFRLLKQKDSTILFIVVEANNGGLIDHAWCVSSEISYIYYHL